MATAVVEKLVPACVGMLLEKLKDLTTKLDDPLLKKLRSTLERLQDLVNDAEEKQFTKPDVKRWLVELRGAAFEAEDLFDQINTDALRRSVEAEYSKLPNFLSSCFNFLSSCFSFSNKNINVEMQTLLERLEGYAKEGHEHHGLITGASSSVLHGTPPTSSVAVDISAICGRHKDIKKLKGFLLSKHADEDGGEIGVVSIVGMGGLGKTTLAKLLYHDPEVDKKFNLKGWAHISKGFDEVKVTKALLESITKKAPEANNLDTLQVQLQESLNGKVFLLVLDDIWDVNYIVWDSLKNIFKVGEAGSRIIITTRDAGIPPAMQTVHKLDPLESEQCWSLLAKHAFGASNNQQRSDLEGIGREIAQKCGGLPLAAVALGGLLRKKLSQDHWNHVLKSNIWELGDAEVKPALLLSYYYLPGHLKRCFAYCAIFPKNYKLKKEMIVPLWIAEGLVLQPESEKSLEKEAEEYFDELVSRSLIQRQSVDGNEIFEMHDLMNELATKVSSPYCASFHEQKPQESLERVRYLSYDAENNYNKFDRLPRLKGLRTFLYFSSESSLLVMEVLLLHIILPTTNPLKYSWYIRKSDKELHNLLQVMKRLRSLSLAWCIKFTKVPTSIGNLIYLRYLNLSGTKIKKLPSVTCKLVNLQTLLVSYCKSLIELPEDMGKLVSLRNLDVSGTPLREMPVQIGKLKTLQTLSNFIVSKQRDGLKVGELGKLPHLRGKLSISELQNVIYPSDASQANLETKKQIDKLILDWHHPAPSYSNSQIQSDVLKRLKPTINLKSLTIGGYGGTNFPNWLGNSSYGNMVYLKIKFCDNCSCLPPIGQLHNLKELFVQGMQSIKSIGAEFYESGNGPSFQPFPSLETLSFEDMPEWEEWKLIGGTTTEFPILRRLTLKGCSKLKGNIPTNLLSLIHLELYECPLLVEALMNMEAPLLPTSLVTLKIEDLGDIQCLDGKWLHHLTSLQNLDIRKAPNLKSLPEEGFPSSLSRLSIHKCPLLEAILQGKQGKEWSKIAHIPDIYINDKQIKSVSVV